MRVRPSTRPHPATSSRAGRRSEVGLYDYRLATYEAADRFNHADAAGFVRLWGLGVETWASRQALAGEPSEPGGESP